MHSYRSCNDSTHLFGRDSKWSTKRSSMCEGLQTAARSRFMHSSRVAEISSPPSVVMLSSPEMLSCLKNLGFCRRVGDTSIFPTTLHLPDLTAWFMTHTLNATGRSTSDDNTSDPVSELSKSKNAIRGSSNIWPNPYLPVLSGTATMSPTIRLCFAVIWRKLYWLRQYNDSPLGWLLKFR